MSEYIVEFGYEPTPTNTPDMPIGEEIVRCRDCKRWRDECEWNRFFNDPDLDEPFGFCAWADRREQ